MKTIRIGIEKHLPTNVIFYVLLFTATTCLKCSAKFILSKVLDQNAEIMLNRGQVTVTCIEGSVSLSSSFLTAMHVIPHTNAEENWHQNTTTAKIN